MAITINEGTQTNVLTDLVVGTETQVVRLDMGDGTAESRFGGTITELTNIVGGTIISDRYTFRHADSFGSVGTVAGTANTNVHAAVAGSVIYATDVVISSNGASEVTLYSGDDTSTVLLGPLHLAANGGMVGNFVTPLETTSGSALICKQTGSGTISVLAKGYID